MKLPKLGLILPCFNEEEVLSETNGRLIPLLNKMQADGLISVESTIYYIDDGSSDSTWKIIEFLSKKYKEVAGIKLSRNRGHQNALFCGLMTAPGDVLISVDADLQDDLNVIEKMIVHYRDGCDIVYGVRKHRDTDTYFKRFSAELYYKILAAVGVDIVFNHADYRLLSRRALNSLSEYNEVNLFLRGLIRMLGYKSEIVEYDRAKRYAGESKYPLSKMLSFAWQGVTSFSTAPLRFITFVGMIVSICSVIMAFWALGTALLTDKALPGWASTVVPMYFFRRSPVTWIGDNGRIYCKNLCGN